MSRAGLLVVAATVLALAGCAPVQSGPPEACLDALEAAATSGDEARGELLAWSATACETQTDWLAALKQYPDALGYPSAEAVDDAEALEQLCSVVDDSATICQG